MVKRVICDIIFVSVCISIILLCALIQVLVMKKDIEINPSKFFLSLIIVYLVIIVLDFIKIIIWSLFDYCLKPNKNLRFRLVNAQKVKIEFDKEKNDMEYAKLLVSSHTFHTLIDDSNKDRSLNARYSQKFDDMRIFLIYFITLVLFISRYDAEYEITHVARECLMDRRLSKYGFGKLHTLPEVYDYLQHTVIESLYEPQPEGWHVAWPNLKSTKLISEVVLVQNRYEDLVLSDKPLLLTKDYLPGWKPKTADSPAEVNPPWRISNPWSYGSIAVTRIASHWFNGNLYKFPLTDGYIAHFAKTKAESLAILEYLKTNNWLSLNTATLNIHFTLYNVDLNIFMAVDLILEKSPFADIQTQDRIQAFELLHDVEDLPVKNVLIIGIYALSLISLLKMIILKAINTSNFFDITWNYLDIVILLLNGISIIFFVFYYFVGQRLKVDILANNPERYVNIDESLSFYFANKVVYCLLIFISVLRLGKILLVWEHFELFTLTLHKSIPASISYLVVVPTILFGFALSSVLIKGDYVHSFAHLFPCMASLIVISFGFDIYNENEISEMKSFLELVLLGLLLFTIKLILANMFGAIICERFVEASATKIDKHLKVSSFTNFLRMQLGLKYNFYKNKKSIMRAARKKKKFSMKPEEHLDPLDEPHLQLKHERKLEHLEKLADMYKMQITYLTSTTEEFLDEMYVKENMYRVHTEPSE